MSTSTVQLYVIAYDYEYACLFARIQEERQERRKFKHSVGLDDQSRKSRFEPQGETVAAGVSLGLSGKLPGILQSELEKKKSKISG